MQPAQRQVRRRHRVTLTGRWRLLRRDDNHTWVRQPYPLTGIETVMIRPFRRSIIFSLLSIAPLLTGSAMAELPLMKPDELKDIFGKWFITSFEMAPISAVSIEEAKSYVGHSAFFDTNVVQFAQKKCENPIYREALSLTPGSTIDIIIECKEGDVVPNLSYSGKSHRLLAELDGATYKLSREEGLR
jgi:hypothetical protein